MDNSKEQPMEKVAEEIFDSNAGQWSIPYWIKVIALKSMEEYAEQSVKKSNKP